MFTGIIELMGKVKELTRMGQAGRLRIELGSVAREVRPGESLSIEGVCLTVTEITGEVVSFDVSHETLKRSTLGELAYGQRVNIERALKVGERLGGHFVQGHVDGTGTIQKKEERPGQTTMWFSVDKKLTDSMVEKGSVAVDGVSLTIVELLPTSFSVALIPYTLENTTLGLKRAGSRVNVETDVLGKWVKRLLVPMSEGGVD